MGHRHIITAAEFFESPRHLQLQGILAFLNIQFDNTFGVGSIKMRRGPDGKTRLVYPTKPNPEGHGHPYFNILNQGVSEDFRHQIFEHLDIREDWKWERN